MLEEISIENFAVIKNMNAKFDRGLNVITGPTGSGKTLIIEALLLTLGKRADFDYLRGEGNSDLNAYFYLQNGDNQSQEFDEPEIFVNRKLTQDQRSPAYLNDERIRLKELRSVCRKFIDFHGQHDNQVVFDNQYPIRMLDRYGSYKNLVDQYRSHFDEYREHEQKLKNIINRDDVDQRIDYLHYQIEELEEFNPPEDEWNEIEKRRKKLEEAEDINQAFQNIIDILDSHQNPLTQVKNINQAFRTVSEAFPDMDPWDEELNKIKGILKEFRERIGNKKAEMNVSQNEFEDLMDRRGQWLELSRKHDVLPENLPNHFQNLKDEYSELQNLEARKSEIKSKLKDQKETLESLADDLHEKRVLTAENLEKEIVDRLQKLNLSDAKFRIDIEEGELNQFGYDQVEWKFSSHEAQSPGPLKKRVSGGEISRVLLALKSTIAEADRTPVLVFDEIDTGISGEEADQVGRELRSLSKSHQLICITHLPLIAAYADRHLQVIRDDHSEYPDISVNQLEGEDRVEEISRLISGAENSDVSRKQAEKLIEERSGSG